MRLATMHFSHFFLSFAAILVSGILMAIETGLLTIQQVVDQASV